MMILPTVDGGTTRINNCVVPAGIVISASIYFVSLSLTPVSFSMV